MQSQDTPAPSVDRLIVRLEAAHMGNRELDEAIATLIWGPPKPSGNFGGPRTLVWWSRGIGRSVAPEFTNSLDAAMTLIPDWVFVRLERYSDGWYVTLRPKSDSDLNQERGDQKPVALAVCIAAIKARRFSPPTEPASDRTTSNTEDHK